MDRWQTTVRGSTWQEINDAAEEAVYAFFPDNRDLQLSVFSKMDLDIQPGEIVITRGGDGGVVDERIDSYEATVTAVF